MTIQIRIATPWPALMGKAVLAAALIAAPAAFAQPAGGKSTEAKSSGAKSSEAKSESPSAGKEYTVVLSAMDYGAIPKGLKVGDSIVWVNRDTVIHSVTARDHSFDLRLNPGQSGKMTLTAPGKIAFYCLFHPNMRGSMTISAK